MARPVASPSPRPFPVTHCLAETAAVQFAGWRGLKCRVTRMVWIRPPESVSAIKSSEQRFQRTELLFRSRSRGAPSSSAARLSVVFPGRIPASLDSAARILATGLPKVLVCATAPAANGVNRLTLAQNRVQARFKVFLSLAPQFVPFHRQYPLDRFNPVEQFLDVLACFRGVFAPVGIHRHPLPEGFLHRMVGTVEWVRSRPRSQQSRMSCKQVLESQIRTEISLGLARAAVVERSAANKLQRQRA